MNEIVNLFFKIALSKWWYFLTMVVFVLFLRFLFTDSPEYVLKQKNFRKTAQLTILIVLCGFILVFIGFLVFFGFIGDLANDLNMVMVTATGFVLLAIFLGSRLTRKQGKPEIAEGWACAYTTNNEHEAQLLRIGLEGGIKVVLQRKSDAEAPNSSIHKVEIFVLTKDQKKAREFLDLKTRR